MPKKIYEIGPALGFVIFQCRRIAKKERKREEEKTVKLVEHFPEKLWNSSAVWRQSRL
jgi:hypothetical protein